MKILFLSHYYPPEGNAPASRVSALAERWVKAGHEVTVVTCAPNVPDGILYPGYRNCWRKTEFMNGVKVVRIWTYIAPNKGTFRRIINYVSYMVSAFFCCFWMKRPDIMIATSPQFFCGWAGALLHWVRRFPFVLEIRDIWPDSLVAVNAGLPKLILKVISVMERMMYRAADHVVTVGPGYVGRLKARHVPEDRLSVIMNGVDKTLFFPRSANEELLKKYGLSGKFICAYVGTIGMASGLKTTLDAAEILKQRNRDDIRIVLVGDGALREELQADAAARKLDNLIFTGRRPKSEVPDWIASSDINLVHLKKCDLFTTVMPSKIFESAGCARPLLMGVDGFAKKLVLDAEAGISIEPENALQMADVLERLAAEPEFCRKLGENAYANIASKFDRDVQAEDYVKLLKTVRGR